MKRLRIVFLDFDGVLNSTRFYKHRPSHEFKLDRVAVRRLNRLLDASGAKVVVSSTWRMGRSIVELQRVLDSYGFTGEVIGRTKVLSTYRGYEIRQWMVDTRLAIDIESFVILDDDSDMVDLLDRLVQTTHMHGLCDRHVREALELLETPVRQRDWFPVTDPELDAPDGAIVDGYQRVGSIWKRIAPKRKKG